MDPKLNTPQKALRLNQDPAKIGTFAEIGAGQEVVRWFFHVGHAAGTIAKSISAYDMAVSDDLYGPTDRYVSRQRLEAMLQREFSQLTDRPCTHNDDTLLFAYADTVATRSYSKHRDGHGWLGIRFQAKPREEASEIIIHAKMLDTEPVYEQESIGILGVNLVYGAFYCHDDPKALITSLMDALNRRRIEIDMIRFSGPVFAGIDNRLMSLQLVEQSLTDAALFTAAGEVVQPSEVLFGKRVIIERGSFRPVTNVTLEMLNRSIAQLKSENTAPDTPVILMEMTLENLMGTRDVDTQDFLARADVLGTLSQMVMISNYTRFDRVTTYLRSYTKNAIAMIMGVPTLQQVFEEKYYSDLDGGLLQGLSDLFRGPVRLLVHPTKDSATGEISTADNFQVKAPLTHLYRYFYENGFIVPIREFDAAQLDVTPGDVLKKLQSGDASWEQLVPPAAAGLIKERRFFGYHS